MAEAQVLLNKTTLTIVFWSNARVAATASDRLPFPPLHTRFFFPSVADRVLSETFGVVTNKCNATNEG
jgi:hypothetical protein